MPTVRRLVWISFAGIAYAAGLLSPVRSAHAAEPFFAPAQASGQLEVRLHPIEGVAAGTEQLITFGVPFIKGSIRGSELTRVRVMKEGVEVPAYVGLATPWRTLATPSPADPYVRFAHVQIRLALTVTHPNFERITVQWGPAVTRSANVATLTNARSGWRQVLGGSFQASHNVFEPAVYAIPVKQALTQGVYEAGRMNPLHDSVPEAQADAAAIDNQTFPAYIKYDHAQKNFFYTLLTLPYLTDYEPWLYDRASAIYMLCFRSGSLNPCREAVRASVFYMDRINAQGHFDFPAGHQDVKYNYLENMAYTFWFTGDGTSLSKIPSVISRWAVEVPSARWINSTTSYRLLTERHVGFMLLANVIAFELNGDLAIRDRIQTAVNDLVWWQNGADGALPASRVDGSLLKYGGQAGSEYPDTVLGFSPWMSALIAQPMVRIYALTEDPTVGHFVRRLGNAVARAGCIVTTDHFYGTTPSLTPLYLAGANGQDVSGEGAQGPHAINVAAIAAWGAYFGDLLGQPDAGLVQVANDLYKTYEMGVDSDTRPPTFRVNPPRQYAWQYRTSSSFSWLLRGSTTTAPPSAPTNLRIIK